MVRASLLEVRSYPINPEMPSLSATLYITRSFHIGPNNLSPPTMKVVAQVIRITEKITQHLHRIFMYKKLHMEICHHI
jgi:hypothetical protein